MARSLKVAFFSYYMATVRSMQLGVIRCRTRSSLGEARGRKRLSLTHGRFESGVGFGGFTRGSKPYKIVDYRLGIRVSGLGAFVHRASQLNQWLSDAQVASRARGLQGSGFRAKSGPCR